MSVQRKAVQPKLPRAIIASVGIDDALLAQIDDAVAGGVDPFEPLRLGIGDARLDIEAGRMLQHEFAGIGVGAHHHDPATLDRAGGKKGLAEQLSGFRLDRQIEHAAFAHDRTPAGEIAKSVPPIPVTSCVRPPSLAQRFPRPRWWQPPLALPRGLPA